LSSIKARISKILVPLDESAMNADYALLIAKQSNAELIAIHAVRTEDAYNERLSLDSDFAFAFNLNFISLMFLSSNILIR
jgi:nucleotide-binding universal stress UspA family protein